MCRPWVGSWSVMRLNLLKFRPLCTPFNFRTYLSQPHFEGVWGWHSHSWNGDLGVLRDFQIFKARLQGLKNLALKLYCWKGLIDVENVDVENGLAWIIRTSIAQVKHKRRAGGQTGNLTSNTKSWESIRPWCVRVECNTPLESSWGELQVWFRLHLNQRSKQRVMNSQCPGSLNRNNFETLPWESRESKPEQFRNSSLGVPGKRAIRM
jgi:hypothetical protein